MKVAIVTGKGEGPTKLNAFDNALLDAGIGDVNLIKVSSMLAGGCEVVELEGLKAGDMVNCVLSNCESDKKGQVISAAIGLAIGDNLGCVVEKSGCGEDIEAIRSQAKSMVEYMMDVRNEKINTLIIEEINHKVENIGSVVACVVYLKD